MGRMFRSIDLFAGCGGCTVGLKQAKFEVAGAVEIDERACRVYRDNHPEVTLWPIGIECLTAERIFDETRLQQGDLDLLAGCPPCQGFSSVRTLNGHRTVEDRRNDLIHEFERLVLELEPKAVMLENVPGLATDARLEKFVQSLKDQDYTVTTNILDASHYGVPQRRRRLILFAGRYGKIRFPNRARIKPTVRTAIGLMKPPGTSGDPIHDAPERRAEHVRQIILAIPKDGGSRTALPYRLQLDCHKRCDGFKDIYGRMAWDAVAPTLTTGCFNPSRGRFLHPEEDRNITMREAALLQTFPRDYRFPPEIGKTHLASLIGNALPPEFVSRLARAVGRYLERVPAKAARP